MYRVRKPLSTDQRRKDRRKELTLEEFKKLIETDFPDRRSYQDRRGKPRRKTDRGKG